jgi:hypothetical protein
MSFFANGEFILEGLNREIFRLLYAGIRTFGFFQINGKTKLRYQAADKFKQRPIGR